MAQYGGIETVIACNVAGAVTLIAVPTPLGVVIGCVFLVVGTVVAGIGMGGP